MNYVEIGSRLLTLGLFVMRIDESARVEEGNCLAQLDEYFIPIFYINNKIHRETMREQDFATATIVLPGTRRKG